MGTPDRLGIASSASILIVTFLNFSLFLTFKRWDDEWRRKEGEHLPRPLSLVPAFVDRTNLWRSHRTSPHFNRKFTRSLTFCFASISSPRQDRIRDNYTNLVFRARPYKRSTSGSRDHRHLSISSHSLKQKYHRSLIFLGEIA